jgi:hypothetical protein
MKNVRYEVWSRLWGKVVSHLGSGKNGMVCNQVWDQVGERVHEQLSNQISERVSQNIKL